MTSSVLFIGAGITGALSAFSLQSRFPNVSITVWDKARGVGGRMTTSHSPTNSACFADLGAQYITTTLRTMNSYKSKYDTLFNNKLLVALSTKIEGMKEFPNDTRHFVAPFGMSSLVKHYLSVLPLKNVKTEQHVSQIKVTDHKYSVSTVGGVQENFDIVIVTIPVPQILQLDGLKDIITSKSDICMNLQSVTYSSRFVLILFYDFKQLPDVSWGCKYLNHSIFRYVSIDNIKRQKNSDPVAVVFHTSVQFGLDNLERTLSEMEKPLLNSAKELFPEWSAPQSVKVHKWRYSQVQNAYQNRPGCVVLSDTPLLILGGDGFCESNLDSCMYSSDQIVHAVQQYLD